MAAEIFLAVTPRGFEPVTAHDRELHHKYAVGTTVRAQIAKPQSKKMLAFYWALIGYVAEGVGYQKTPLSDELLIRCGYIDKLKFKNGEVHAIPKSISDMPHEERRAYVDAAIALICEEYVGDMRRSTLIREVERMLPGIYYNDLAGDDDNETIPTEGTVHSAGRSAGHRGGGGQSRGAVRAQVRAAS